MRAPIPVSISARYVAFHLFCLCAPISGQRVQLNMMPPAMRKSRTVKFKCCAAEYALQDSNRTAGRHFDMGGKDNSGLVQSCKSAAVDEVNKEC